MRPTSRRRQPRRSPRSSRPASRPRDPDAVDAEGPGPVAVAPGREVGPAALPGCAVDPGWTGGAGRGAGALVVGLTVGFGGVGGLGAGGGGGAAAGAGGAIPGRAPAPKAQPSTVPARGLYDPAPDVL